MHYTEIEQLKHHGFSLYNYITSFQFDKMTEDRKVRLLQSK